MKKVQPVNKSNSEKLKLEAKLSAILQSKTIYAPTARRFGKLERELILQGVAELGLAKTCKLCGVRSVTIDKWQRRLTLASESVNASSLPVKVSAIGHSVGANLERSARYHGYHVHWQKALDIWKSCPGLGPAQIKNQLRRDGIKISVSTVRNILEENGYTPPKSAEKPDRVLRYEAARPRELIHMDFKHFYINKNKSFLLLMQDDYSRFLCGHGLTDSENMKVVIATFEYCISRYGRMRTIMTDAGSSFYSWNGLNKFQKLISDEYGIDHIKAGSPRSNGKVESVNKQIEKELLDIKHFASLAEAEQGINDWIEFYNFKRTHMGLPSGEVPADRFLYGWNRSVDIPKQESDSNPVWAEVLKMAMLKIK